MYNSIYLDVIRFIYKSIVQHFNPSSRYIFASIAFVDREHHKMVTTEKLYRKKNFINNQYFVGCAFYVILSLIIYLKIWYNTNRTNYTYYINQCIINIFFFFLNKNDRLF